MDTGKLKCLADFAVAIEMACCCDHEGREEQRNVWLLQAYSMAGDIRNLSRDERWKAPCNAFRAAFQQRGAKGYEDALDLGAKLIPFLPTDAEVSL